MRRHPRPRCSRWGRSSPAHERLPVRGSIQYSIITGGLNRRGGIRLCRLEGSNRATGGAGRRLDTWRIVTLFLPHGQGLSRRGEEPTTVHADRGPPGDKPTLALFAFLERALRK